MDYEKVIKDFNDGTLDSEKVTLVMDNDDGYWSSHDDSLSESENEKVAESLEKKYGRPGGYQDIVDVLNAAGVNTDWC